MAVPQRALVNSLTIGQRPLARQFFFRGNLVVGEAAASG
jgi:hypothetical protein